MNKKQYESIVAYLFLLPNLAGYLLFFLIPLVFSLLLVFSEWNFISGLQGIRFIGLRNLLEFPTDTWFVNSLRNTVVFTVVTVPLAMILGLLVAVALNEGVYFPKVTRTLFFMPHITSIVAVATVWLALFHPTRGPINQVLRSLGVTNPPGWVASSDWSLIAVIITGVWAAIGYQMLIYLAGLQGIPNELYESARIDGASPVQSFFAITIPLLLPTTFFLLITNVIGSFQVFAQVNLMTQGGPGTSSSVLVFYIYRAGFQYYRMGYASAMAWVLFAIIFAVTFVQWKIRKRLMAVY